MSNGGYAYVKVFFELVKWRDSIKDRRKAEKIQRVINRKLEYLKRIQYPYLIILYKVNDCGLKQLLQLVEE